MPYTEAEVSLEEYLSVSIALYRKYRSRNFDELIGQEHVTRSLKNALKAGRISHAYLFSGPRGVGKTSAARILAHAVNKLELDPSANVLDIIEIDAASNRRIDEVRELREKVHIAPSQHAYKVYIVDEVHMLTREAFNALLKTLEEPPAHAIFILATTEPHKLPDTIISRTQHFLFRPVPAAKVQAHLAQIAKDEGLKIEPDALGLLARAGGGSLRDSISLLDQLASLSESKITVQEAAKLLGYAELPLIEELAAAMAAREPKAALAALQALWQQGIGPILVVEQSLEYWRSKLHEHLNTAAGEEGRTAARIIQLLSAFDSAAPHPEASLEASVLEYCLTAPMETNSHAPTPAQAAPERPAPPKAAKAAPQPKPQAPKTAKTPQQTNKKGAQTTQKVQGNEDHWLKALSIIKASNNSLYALLRAARPEFSDDTVTVHFRFLFHKRRLEESKNRQLLEAALEKVTGRPHGVVAEFSAAGASNERGTPAKDTQATAVLDILGGEIVK